MPKPAWKQQIKMKKCKYCLSKENLTIDHKNPVSKGGSNELKNLQCLCERCNKMKASLSEGDMKRLWKFFRQVDEERVNRGGRRRFDKIN